MAWFSAVAPQSESTRNTYFLIPNPVAGRPAVVLVAREQQVGTIFEAVELDLIGIARVPPEGDGRSQFDYPLIDRERADKHLLCIGRAARDRKIEYSFLFSDPGNNRLRFLFD